MAEHFHACLHNLQHKKNKIISRDMMRSGIHFVAQNVRAQEYRELRIFSQPVPFNGAATMLLLLRLLLVFFLSLSLSLSLLSCSFAVAMHLYLVYIRIKMFRRMTFFPHSLPPFH